MILDLVGLLAGLALLTVAADQFVIGAARIATALRVSPVVVGAVVIGVGTSAPELLVSALAAWQGSVDIGVGNVVGSNLANLTLVLGTAALIAPLAVRSATLVREAPLSLGAVLLLALVLQRPLDGLSAAALLAALVAGVAVLVRGSRDEDPLAGELDEVVDDEPRPRLGREAVRALLGLAGTVGGAQLLVTAASSLAADLGLAEGFVGVTIVAIGTSLPELATAVQASRRGETDLIVGNLLGSNLFNSTAVMGTAALVGPPVPADPSLTGLATAAMVAVAVAATVMMVTRNRVDRWEGALLLVGYVAVVPLLAG